jgi:C1A family cysteine protease
MKFITDNEEYYAIGGLLETSPDDRPNKCDDWEDDFGSGNGFPEKVDLRHLMTPVEDQKNVGSCTANAVAGAYEYLCNVRARQTNDEPGDISRLFIYYVTRKYDQARRGESGALTDRGSTISGAIDVLNMKGACLEETHPYDTSYVNHPPSAESYDEALNYKISKAWKINTGVDEFKQVLSMGYPIIFGCKLTESFHEKRGKGIIRTPSDWTPAKQHGAHAMLIVGYYDSHQVFVVRNSWGEDWGYDGYCFMSYDYLAHSELNMGQNYAIQGLSDYDFTPDDDGGCDLSDIDYDEETEECVEVEIVEGEMDEEGEDDEDFDPDEFFSALHEAKKVFDKFDMDGSGMMDMEELATALMMNSHFVTEEIIEAIKEEREDDLLSFAEFLEILGIEVPEYSNEEYDDEEEPEYSDEEECDEE